MRIAANTAFIVNGTAIFFLVFVLAVLLVCCEEGRDYGTTRESDEKEEIEDVFIPTKEWQEVKKGQSIPPGLHIRLDFQTGLREAKLLEEGEDGSDIEKHHVSLGTQDESVGSEDKPYGTSDRRGVVNKRTKVFSPEEVHEMMKNLNTNSDQMQRISSDTSSPSSVSSEHAGTDLPDTTERRTMSAKDLPVTFHRDAEVMINLSRILATNSSTPQELCEALGELEYYVHQIDNARDLNVIGGLVLVIRLLNHTHPEVRSWAAHVLGSATQSNPSVQQQAVEYGTLGLLCSLVAASQPDLVQRRGLFALSALLRGSVQEQLHFIRDHQGLELLGNTFPERSPAVQLKAVVLLTDLLNEELVGNSSGVHYLELPVLVHSSVMGSGWCGNVVSLVRSNQLVRVEKGLLAMELLVSTCGFAGEVQTLQELQWQLEADSSNTQDSEFPQQLLQRCKSLLRSVRKHNSEL